jgi:hypothetical protein
MIMETIILTISIILFVLILFSNDDDNSLKDLEQELDIPYKDRYYNSKPKEEEFYHPVTGYKGTKSEMDAYIINREKNLKK